MVAENKNDTVVFWGCFIALITTAFGFITRMFLINEWGVEFGLDQAEKGRLGGIGVWPFAVSIIGFSLFIDKIGYKTAMIIAFVGHLSWAVIGVSAYFVSKGGDTRTAYMMIYWGSLVLALANGTVEAFINPVVATLFSKEKTKWLNILHAGWPGGLVIAGIIVILMGNADWYVKVGIIALPTVFYFLVLITKQFPVQERVSSGVTYREMLAEFGVLGAAVVGVLVTLQLIDFASQGGTEVSTGMKLAFAGIGLAIVVAFGAYTRALGRPLMFVLVLIMLPLATTEIGTDGWITGIMEGVSEGKFHPGWVLVYTSAIMMILRFFAGPIVHTLSPLGLLCLSTVLAIIGLATLSMTQGMVIFGAATLYGVGKTFFWPTMLGVVAEQTPKGGALTLNAISGIGMLAVGTLGFPYIGTLTAEKQIQAVAKSEEGEKVKGLVDKDGELTVLEDKRIYEIIPYQDISNDKLNALILDTAVGELPQVEQDAFNTAVKSLPDKAKNPDDPDKPINKQEALRNQLAALPPDAAKKVSEEIKESSGESKSAMKAAVDAIEEPKSEKEVTALVEKVPEKERAPLSAYAKERKDLNASLLELDDVNRAAVVQVIPKIEKDQESLKGGIKGVRDRGNQGALLNMAIFPAIMLIGYICLIFYFKSKGGYDAQVLTGHEAKDEEYTGGVEGPVE